MGNLLGEDGVGEEKFFKVLEGVLDFDDGGVEEGDVGFMGAGRCYAASTSSGVVAASTAALRSPPRCIVSFLCFMAPPA